MTVAELIENLEHLPLDLPVKIHDHEWGEWNDITYAGLPSKAESDPREPDQSYVQIW